MKRSFVIGALLLALGWGGATSGRADDASDVRGWCDKLQNELTKVLKWRQQVCKGVNWQVKGHSVQNQPLIYADFGDPKASNVTLVLAMVHGDEITPLFIGIELAQWMQDNPDQLKNKRVIIAPLVNPDGFYARPRTRVNARGVDVNRNFRTKDWDAKALQAWKRRYRSDPRRFPGSAPASEPETVFQKELIEKFLPQKILSIHSPLNHTDYDGPSSVMLHRFSQDYVKECLRLRKELKAISTGFFPGSLGNYAGQEKGIPTVTLELPTANPRKARVYWNQFKPGIHNMIDFKMPDLASLGRP